MKTSKYYVTVAQGGMEGLEDLIKSAMIDAIEGFKIQVLIQIDSKSVGSNAGIIYAHEIEEIAEQLKKEV